MEFVDPQPPQKRPLDPFRRAVVRGLGVLLPPLLTVVILVWIGNTVANYLLDPMEAAVRRVLIRHYENQVVPINREPEGTPAPGVFVFSGESGETYRRIGNDGYVPSRIYDDATNYLDSNRLPDTTAAFHRAYVDRKFLAWYIVVPIFSLLFILLLYFLGKFLAAGVGRFFWMQFERVIHRLPVVRNVYSSVKQVTDFMFSEREIEYTRVVAIEYPRKGIWSLAMVTGESMLDIACAANEPVVSLLVPTSPMPFTGFTITVRKSEILDLNITIDQAFQFIVSCGVVVPPHQLSAALAERQKGSLPPSDM
ncbi:MAG: hypothetical protein CMJ58_00700 [Planctomycetaceae bacterium]|nr:hypothetical protein [Planctomycetaceae bacterium]